MKAGPIGVAMFAVHGISVYGFQHHGISPVGLLASRTLRKINQYIHVNGVLLPYSQGSPRMANNPALTETPMMTPNTTEASAANAFGGEAYNDQASLWRAQAERIREEANKLDAELTLQKVEAIEKKLNNTVWQLKNPDQLESLQRQLEILQAKLETRKPSSTENEASSINGVNDANFGSRSKKNIIPSPAAYVGPSSNHSAAAKKEKVAQNFHIEEENPLCGYDQADLDLYLPVVIAIEERLPSNATMQEKIEAFQSSPELQEHFQEKINKLLVEPMQDMIRLEQLRQDYLESTSSVERANIKRQIERIEATMENEGPVIYSDSIFYEGLPALEDEEIQRRLEAVGSLHPILQALYKKRSGVNETDEDNLRLAIEMEHYEPQLQLLEQVRYLDPITDDVRHEIRLAILSLPLSVRNQFARKLGLEIQLGDTDTDVTAMINALVDSDNDQWTILRQALSPNRAGGSDGDIQDMMSSLDLPEYSDLDFMDRSRYVKEFLPSLARLEMVYPPLEDIETLINKVLDKKAFMVTSPPERVLGGYYIPGRNLLSESGATNSDEMVSLLQERLQKSPLKDKIDLFYIQNPSPPTDEEYEMGEIVRPLLVAVAKNRDELYNPANPLIKTTVSLLGLVSIVLFSAATAGMQPFMQNQIMAAAAGDMSIDLAPILGSTSQVAASIIAIQASHEFAHRIVASRDNFVIGLPTLVPSIQIGLQGAITPFKSPPPNNKSLFDFAIAGPLAGLLVSVVFLLVGIIMTSSVDLATSNELPAFPTAILRSSSLGGGLVEFFLGKGVLMPSSAATVLPLHPFAIAGFVGLLSNALALLPLGNTDGGRVSQTMFGRRGAFLVSIIATLVLCAMGLFGLDEPRLLSTYILFVTIWQRELEAPTLNEVDELDFPRGLVGIGSSIIVVLALMPMING